MRSVPWPQAVELAGEQGKPEQFSKRKINVLKEATLSPFWEALQNSSKTVVKIRTTYFLFLPKNPPPPFVSFSIEFQ